VRWFFWWANLRQIVSHASLLLESQPSCRGLLSNLTPGVQNLCGGDLGPPSGERMWVY
jgi:hypothetical protein